MSNIALSVLLLTKDENDNLSILIPELLHELHKTSLSFEIVIIEGGSEPSFAALQAQPELRPIRQELPGYGNAFKQGIKECIGNLIITIDGDYSHPPAFIHYLLAESANYDLVVASRYCEGGSATMPLLRAFLSKTVCSVFRLVFNLPIADLSSGYRCYTASQLRPLKLTGRDFEILLEVLISLAAKGCSITEVPFSYQPRRYGSSHARLFRFGVSYFKMFCLLVLKRVTGKPL
jgi:dolichol-phosphate mannosyltransferase